MLPIKLNQLTADFCKSRLTLSPCDPYGFRSNPGHSLAAQPSPYELYTVPPKGASRQHYIIHNLTSYGVYIYIFMCQCQYNSELSQKGSKETKQIIPLKTCSYILLYISVSLPYGNHQLMFKVDLVSNLLVQI